MLTYSHGISLPRDEPPTQQRSEQKQFSLTGEEFPVSRVTGRETQLRQHSRAQRCVGPSAVRVPCLPLEGTAVWQLRPEPSSCHGLHDLAPGPGGHTLASSRPQEKDGMGRGVGKAEKAATQPWLHISMPCGRPVSAGTESQRVCRLRRCVDGRQQEQLVAFSLWPLLTLLNTNVLLKILFQVNSQKKIDASFVFRLHLHSLNWPAGTQ